MPMTELPRIFFQLNVRTIGKLVMMVGISVGRLIVVLVDGLACDDVDNGHADANDADGDGDGCVSGDGDDDDVAPRDAPSPSWSLQKRSTIGETSA